MREKEQAKWLALFYFAISVVWSNGKLLNYPLISNLDSTHIYKVYRRLPMVIKHKFVKISGICVKIL